jgi:ATP-dependent Lon protease
VSTKPGQLHLQNLQDSLRGSDIHLNYEITWDSIHGRSIKTDTGWKISPDLGVDIFQGYGENSFDLGRGNQEQRRCNPFEVTVSPGGGRDVSGRRYCRNRMNDD